MSIDDLGKELRDFNSSLQQSEDSQDGQEEGQSQEAEYFDKRRPRMSNSMTSPP